MFPVTYTFVPEGVGDGLRLSLIIRRYLWIVFICLPDMLM